MAAASPEYFEAKVRPVLAASCYDCHTEESLGGLRLDSREGMLKGGKSGPAIVPGDPDKSLMIQAVRQTGDKLKMPKGGRLKPDEVDALVEWVRAGAVWPAPVATAAPATRAAAATYTIKPEQRAFWSFQPIRKPPVPAVSHGDWAKTDIDRFVLARLEKDGLAPVAAADKLTLIRRAYSGFDRPAADARRHRGVSERRCAGCVRESRGSAARVAAVRRNVGPHVARRRPLRRRRLSIARSAWAAATTHIPTRICIATG